MATGYIIWDSKRRVFVAGPFLTTGAADSFLNRMSKHTDSAETSKTSKDQSGQLTRETVTLS